MNRDKLAEAIEIIAAIPENRLANKHYYIHADGRCCPAIFLAGTWGVGRNGADTGLVSVLDAPPCWAEKNIMAVYDSDDGSEPLGQARDRVVAHLRAFLDEVPA